MRFVFSLSVRYNYWVTVNELEGVQHAAPFFEAGF
jgi:hypothetical protein